MRDRLTAAALVAEALGAGPLTHSEIRNRTGLLMGTVKQAMLRLRTTGAVVTYSYGGERRHRLVSEEEREGLRDRQRCALQAAWRGVSA